MKLKQIFFVSTIVILAFIVYSFYFQPRSRHTDNEISVAILLNLTGPPARFDAIKKQAIAIASERLKILYPKQNFNISILDAGGSPDITIAVGRKALENGASYILTGTSPTALAVARIARGHKPGVVQIANAANPDFGPPRPGEYRFWPDWNQEADVIEKHLRDSKMKSVVLIYSADPYSEALQVALKEKAAKQPQIKVMGQQYDPASTPDFRPLLLRAKKEGVDALVVFGLPPGIKALLGQLADVNWGTPIIGGVNINLTTSDYEQSGLKCGLWSVVTESMEEKLPEGSEAEIFRRIYNDKYGSPPPFHALYMADALYFIASAESSLGSADVNAIGKAKLVHHFVSPSGTIQIDNNGVLLFNLQIRHVQ